MPSARVLPLHSKTLMALGRELQCTEARAAAGRCLSTALELAARARARRIEVELVTWQVRGDPDFADHWAVRLDDARVIDPTRIQVDGARRLVCAIDDYPANFRRRRCYPAGVLLRAGPRPAVDADAPSDRIDAAFLLGCRWRLLCFDLARGVASRSPAFVVATCIEAARFLLSFGSGLVRRRLVARAAALEARLQAIGESRPTVRRSRD